MVYFFSFFFIENSLNDEVDNCKFDNELEIEDLVKRKLICQSCQWDKVSQYEEEMGYSCME